MNGRSLHWTILIAEAGAQVLISGTELNLLAEAGAQVLISGTELPVPLCSDRFAKEVFHVEHGDVRRLL